MAEHWWRHGGIISKGERSFNLMYSKSQSACADYLNELEALLIEADTIIAGEADAADWPERFDDLFPTEGSRR